LIDRSFIFIPGVGERTERRLWDEGIDSWSAFLGRERAGPMKGARKERADSLIHEAAKRLELRDLSFFTDLLPSRETWRLWPTFGGNAAFLDIETTGTRRTSPITVVGVHDQRGYRIALRGRNLSTSAIKEMLDDASMLVTFNGLSFDVPIIEHHFPGSVPKVPHLDLLHLARRLGFRGGLKALELQLGMVRPQDVQGMSGEDAVRLWRLYERDGNTNALRLLLKYNMEDIKNLRPIAERLVEMMKDRVMG